MLAYRRFYIAGREIKAGVRQTRIYTVTLPLPLTMACSFAAAILSYIPITSIIFSPVEDGAYDRGLRVRSRERCGQAWLDSGKSARAATAEYKMSLGEAIRKNKRAVMWSMIHFITAIVAIKVGTDTALMPSFYGYPTFQKKYGQYFPERVSTSLPAPGRRWSIQLARSSKGDY